MEKVRIQDDLYTHVNQETLDQLVIPDDKPTAGGFAVLADGVEKLMMDEFNEMSASGNYPNDYLKRAVTLFNLAGDAKRKARHGIKPALKNLSILAKIKDVKAFGRYYKELKLRRIPVPFDLDVDTDMKNTERHCVMISGPGVILPDASYYKEEMAGQRDALLAMWSNIAKAILAQTDLTAEEQELYLNDTLAFDRALAAVVKTREEWSNYIKAYNPMKTSRVATMLKTANFRRILKDLFGELPETVIVAEPRFFKAFTTIFNQDTFEQYKHWAYVTGLYGSCSLLSEELRDLGGAFMRALSGIAAGTPINKFAYQLASQMYSEPVGLYYGEKYFGEEAKKDIIDIVNQIIDTYKSRIEKNDILGPETKEKAILKLSTMGVKMGYPDKVQEIYDKLVFDEKKSLFDVVRSLGRIRTLENLAKLNKPTDPTIWPMPGKIIKGR